MKRILALVLVLVMAFALVSCTANEEPAASATVKPTDSGTATPSATPVSSVKEGGTVNYMIQGEPTTLLSWATRNPIDICVLTMTYEFLLKYDEAGVAQPYLLESITPDETALTYTLVLKDGIKFHDGSDMNADVVAWNINKYKESGVLTGSFYGAVDNAVAKDAKTVVINLNRWDSLFPSALARTCFIASKEAFDTQGEEYLKSHPVGTGAFMFDEWEHDVGVNFVRFDDYWRGKPLLDGVDMVIYTNIQSASAAIKKGDLDIMPVSNFDMALDLQSSDGVELAIAKLTGTGYTLSYMCNNEDDPLNDVRVRQAFSYAIDAKAIAETCTKGFFFDSTQWCVNSNPYYSDKVTGYEYNLQKAKDLLKEAGYEGGGFTTRITLQQNYLEDGAQIIAESLAAIGVTCELNIVEMANYAGYIGSWEYGMLLHPMGTSNGQPAQLAANFVQGLNAGLGVNAFLHTDDVDKLIKDAVAGVGDDVATFQEVAYKVFDEQCMMKVIVLTQLITAHTDTLQDAGLGLTNQFPDTMYLAWLDK